MEWLLLLVAGGGGLGAKRWRSQRALRNRELAELEGIRHLADEDVTVLGEELQRLDEEVKGHELDTATRVDYQAALDAYEAAQRTVPRILRADDISTIIDTLSSGRYALACVQARVAGAPLPELRVPCFFNPQHGPSVANVMWTDPRRGTRTVPACAQDAARVANHEVPAVRRITIGSRTMPYWEAGVAYLPYGQGYFAGAPVMMWAFQAPAVGDGGSHLGGFHGGGFDGGGFDGGGFESGGGDGSG